MTLVSKSQWTPDLDFIISKQGYVYMRGTLKYVKDGIVIVQL